MPYWRIFYHVVWSTKDRQPSILPEFETELYGYLWGKATALDCVPHAINGMPDHLHVVLSVPPRLSIADVVGQLKGASSHHMNATHPEGEFAWQKEYSVFSLSETALEKVVGYVKNQKKHHAEQTLIDRLEHLTDS